MSVILRGKQISPYSDENGNSIKGSPNVTQYASIEFKGSNCRVVFSDRVNFHGTLVFNRSDAYVSMGKWAYFRGRMTLGLGCSVIMGDGFYSGSDLQVTTAEGMDVIFGNDVLVANQCRVRADDSHPIYDGVTGKRINPSGTITVGDHVWIGQEVFLMPGAAIGEGSVIGARSVVTKSRPVPPYTLALGAPAKVHRTKINWVRKHLQLHDLPETMPSIFAADEIAGRKPVLARLRGALVALFG